MNSTLVLACDNNFIAYAVVAAMTAKRISSNHFKIIIVSDNVSDENKSKAKSKIKDIEFIEVSKYLDKMFVPTNKIITRSTYIRLLFDEILDGIEMVLYIDSDTTPIHDLAPLMSMTPKSSPVMATYDLYQIFEPNLNDRLPLSRHAGYLQAGVLVLDLNAIRKEQIFKDALRFAVENPEACMFHDQDALNVVLQGRWQVLDWRWNVTSFDYLMQHQPPYYIRHHTGDEKPWNANVQLCERSIRKQWKSDLAASPWPDRFSPEPFRASAKRLRRRITRPLVDVLGMTPKSRADQKKKIALARNQMSQHLRTVEQLAREGALGRSLIDQIHSN